MKKQKFVIKAVGTASIKVRANLAVHHMLSAAFFARKSYEVESNNVTLTEELYTEHRAYVIASILASIASLEATINELYIDAVDKNSQTFQGIDNSIVEKLALVWEKVEKDSILDKYEFALKVAGKTSLIGEAKYQNAKHVVSLRNALMHFKPEWDTSLKEHKKFETWLMSRFQLNPFAKSDQVFFPHKCLGYGCADWSVRSSIQFIDEFFSRMGLQGKFDASKTRLTTK
jgi:hypothetical protein